MLGYADWIVGGASILVGLALCFGVVAATEYLFELPKVRWLGQRIGHNATRALLVVLGIALVILGIAITQGWKINWQQRESVHASTSDSCLA